MRIRLCLAVGMVVGAVALGAMAEETLAIPEPARYALATNATPAEALAASRAAFPLKPLVIRGGLVRRNRRGTTQAEYKYCLELRRTLIESQVAITLQDRTGLRDLQRATVVRWAGGRPEMALEDLAAGTKTVPALSDSVLDTDVTWLDLTLDFLWWPQVEFDVEREGDTVFGQHCLVLVACPPAAVGKVAAARVWVDRKFGCMLQAEFLDSDAKVIHRLWGTRVKKFDGRWCASVVETECPGSGYRTKITVASIADAE